MLSLRTLSQSSTSSGYDSIFGAPLSSTPTPLSSMPVPPALILDPTPPSLDPALVPFSLLLSYLFFKMKVIAAYLLAVLGGNSNPSAKDLKHILGSVGVEADEDRIDFLLSQVKGKDITELIASGREKFASVPSGGGAISVAAPAGVGAAAPAAPAAAETKKEEKVEEKEESDDDMGFSLFD